MLQGETEYYKDKQGASRTNRVLQGQTEYCKDKQSTARTNRVLPGLDRKGKQGVGINKKKDSHEFVFEQAD